MANRTSARGQRMAKEWHGMGSVAPTAFTANSVALIGGELALDESYTVIRMLGEYVIVPGAAPVANDHALIGIGIGVVSSDAAAVGGTAMPDPVDERGFPWLYWAVHAFNFLNTSTDPSSAGGSIRQRFDIKSMRKIKRSESLVMVAQYTNGNGNPALDFSPSITRVLIAL